MTEICIENYYFLDEAKVRLKNIVSLIDIYKKIHAEKGIIHLPEIARFMNLSQVASPIFREGLELLAIIQLQSIESLLLLNFNTTRIIQGILINLSRRKKLFEIKTYSEITENADFEILISANLAPDIKRQGPFYLVRRIHQAVKTYQQRTLNRHPDIDGPQFIVKKLDEEDKERAYIELFVGHSKITIRDLSSNHYRKYDDPFKLKKNKKRRQRKDKIFNILPLLLCGICGFATSRRKRFPTRNLYFYGERIF